jgi:hypothetical protein
MRLCRQEGQILKIMNSIHTSAPKQKNGLFQKPIPGKQNKGHKKNNANSPVPFGLFSADIIRSVVCYPNLKTE